MNLVKSCVVEMPKDKNKDGLISLLVTTKSQNTRPPASPGFYHCSAAQINTASPSPPLGCFSSGVITASQRLPSHPVLTILFFFFLTLINSYFHCIHKSPLSASSGSPARQFRPQHPSTADAFAVPPLLVFKPSQSGISGFIYQTPNMRRPSDVPTPDPSITHFNLCYHILLPPPARPPVLSSTLPLSEHWRCITWHRFYQQQPPTSYLPIRECSQQHDISLKVHNLLLLSAP